MSLIPTAFLASAARNDVAEFISVSLPASGSMEVTAKAMVESGVIPLSKGEPVSPRFYRVQSIVYDGVREYKTREFSNLVLLYLESCMVTPEQEREAGVRMVRRTAADMVMAEINRQCGTTWQWTPTA